MQAKKTIDDRRASFWQAVVWVNSIVPGTISMTPADFKALTRSDRAAFLDAVNEHAEAMKEAAEQPANTSTAPIAPDSE